MIKICLQSVCLLSGQNINGSAGLHHPAVPEVDVRVLGSHHLVHRHRLRLTREVDLNTKRFFYSNWDSVYKVEGLPTPPHSSSTLSQL